jgi:hypothetical protein
MQRFVHDGREREMHALQRRVAELQGLLIRIEVLTKDHDAHLALRRIAELIRYPAPSPGDARRRQILERRR